MAINAYDETREVVEGFLEKHQPSYPVFLQGKSLAEETFFAHAYPYQLWVNREGVVVHRATGFHVDQVPAIEERIRALLK